MGFATNAVLAGGGSSIMPISQSPMQLSRILEALARVTMDSEGRLRDILSRGTHQPWGVSCLAFAYEQGEASADLKAYLRNRKIPTAFVYARKPPVFMMISTPAEPVIQGWMNCVPGGTSLMRESRNGFLDRRQRMACC